MTAAEYESSFRAEYQVSDDMWRLAGFRTVPCTCGMRDCSGWRVALPDDPATRLQRLRMTAPGEAPTAWF